MADPDRRSPLLESYENAAVIVSGITAEQVTLRTPCPGYDVAGLIDHTVEAAYRAAALGRGRTPPAGDNRPTSTWLDAPAQLRLAAEEAAQAWGDDSRLTSTITMPWGEEYSGATLVNMYLAELAAHAWDLAFATEQLDRLDPSLAVSALDGARAMIQPEYRDMLATGSPFGAEVPPPPDADDWERLAAFMGRNREQRSTGNLNKEKQLPPNLWATRRIEAHPGSNLLRCRLCAVGWGFSVSAASLWTGRTPSNSMSTVTSADDGIVVCGYWWASQNGRGPRGANPVAGAAAITPFRSGWSDGFPAKRPEAWSPAKHSDRIHGFACISQSDVRHATSRSSEGLSTIWAGPLPCIAIIATLRSTVMSHHPAFRSSIPEPVQRDQRCEVSRSGGR